MGGYNGIFVCQVYLKTKNGLIYQGGEKEVAVTQCDNAEKSVGMDN
jgi:hypothetical protein